MARRDLSGAVDFAHLERFTAGDAALAEEVLGLFREQAELWIRLLDPTSDQPGWRDAAHTLKGSAAGIGAFRLASACAEAEAGACASVVERRALSNRVKDALDAALLDVAAYLHELRLRELKGAA